MQLKGKVKEKWGNLTDDDLTAINGRRDQLEGKLHSATASRRIRSEKTLTIGTTPRVGKHSLHLKATSAPLRRGLSFADLPTSFTLSLASSLLRPAAMHFGTIALMEGLLAQ
jgi:uncharacterized protein YjbJ (UPF0337 family)